MTESFSHRLRVRYNECDPQGVVFNGNYFTYFDVAFTELFRAALGSYAVLFEEDSDLVVLEASARFLAAARFDDELAIAMAPVRLGQSSIVTEATVSRGEQILVRGRLVHVCVRPGTADKRELPPRVRRALERYVTAPSATAPAPP